MDENVKSQSTTGKELKPLPVNDKKFTANGNVYFIEDHISISRWNRYEELQLEVAYGTNVKAMQEKLGEVYDLINQQKFADAAVHLHNIRVGVEQLTDDTRYNAVVRMCALIINREGEDRRYISEEIMLQKINDWETEGYDMGSFFAIAISSIPGCIEIFNSITQGISPIKK